MSERLSELQLLLKTEEAETLSQRKTIAAVEQSVQRTSDELVDSFWELCNIDAEISFLTSTPSTTSSSATQPPSMENKRKSHLVQNLSVEVRKGVEEFFAILKLRPDCVVKMLAANGLLGGESSNLLKSKKDEMISCCHAIVFSLFGNCFSPIDERRMLNLIITLWKEEKSLCGTNNNSNNNSSCAFTQYLIGCYLKTTYANPYLAPTVRDAIIAAINLALEDASNARKTAVSNAVSSSSTSASASSLNPNRFRQHVGNLRKSSFVSIQQLSRADFPQTPFLSTGVGNSTTTKRHVTESNPPQPSHFVISTASAVTAPASPPNEQSFRWPKRAAATPEEQFSAILGSPWLISTNFLAKHILAVVANSLPSLPYGLRWIVKNICQQQQQQQQKGISAPFSTRSFVIDLVFKQFIAAAIEHPEEWPLGVHPPHIARRNLADVSRIVLELALGSQIESQDPLSNSIATFIENVTKVEDPETYFSSEAERWEETPLTLVSTFDLGTFLKMSEKLVINQQKKQEEEGEGGGGTEQNQIVSQIHSLGSSIIAKLPHVKSPNMMFLKIRDMSVHSVIGASSSSLKATSSKSPNQREALTNVEQCKHHLSYLLKVLEKICGHKGQDIINALLLQRVRNRFFQANIILSQIQLTVEMLNRLPTEWKVNNFERLLTSMFDDAKARKDERTKQLCSPLIYLSKLQLQESQIRAQKDLSLEHLNLLLFQRFITTEFTGVDDFCSMCESRFGFQSAPCNCKPRVFEDDDNTCPVCREKSAFFNEFVHFFNDQLSQHVTSEEYLKLSVHNLESLVLCRVYTSLFPCLLGDMEFYAKCIDVADDIPLRALLIPERFHSQAPWSLAQKELRKISLFRAPYDKFKVIVDTWKIIFNYLRPITEDLSPDDFLPIMAFVILQTNPPDILSNLQYITLYTALDTIEVVWLLHVKSAVEILKQIFSGKLPMWKSGRPKRAPTGKKPLLGRHTTKWDFLSSPNSSNLRTFSHRSVLISSTPFERLNPSSISPLKSVPFNSTDDRKEEQKLQQHNKKKRTKSAPEHSNFIEDFRMKHRSSNPSSSIAQPLPMRPPEAGEVDPLGALKSSK